MTSTDERTTGRATTTTDPNPFPGLMRRRRRSLRMTSAAALALGLAVSGGAVAGATTPGTSSTPRNGTVRDPSGRRTPVGRHPVAVGIVASVGSGTFTLTTRDGATVTVDVTSSTTFREFGSVSASVGDVTVGARVAVFGTEASDTVTATGVAIGAPPSGWRPPAGDPPRLPSGSVSTANPTAHSAYGNSASVPR